MRQRLTVAAVLLPLISSLPSHAQSKACRGKIVIDSVYGRGLGGGRYEYYLQIHNATSEPLHWQLNFKDLPSGVRADRSELSAQQPLAAHSTLTLRFATGTNASMNLNSVSLGYDVSGKNITASNCY